MDLRNPENLLSHLWYFYPRLAGSDEHSIYLDIYKMVTSYAKNYNVKKNYRLHHRYKHTQSKHGPQGKSSGLQGLLGLGNGKQQKRGNGKPPKGRTTDSQLVNQMTSGLESQFTPTQVREI